MFKRWLFLFTFFFFCFLGLSYSMTRDVMCFDNCWIADPDYIVFGEVIDIKILRSFFVPPITITTVKAERYLRGQGSQKIIILTLGANEDINDIVDKDWVEDQPTFYLKDKGYLFLNRMFGKKVFSPFDGMPLYSPDLWEERKLQQAFDKYVTPQLQAKISREEAFAIAKKHTLEQNETIRAPDDYHGMRLNAQSQWSVNFLIKSSDKLARRLVIIDPMTGEIVFSQKQKY